MVLISGVCASTSAALVGSDFAAEFATAFGGVLIASLGPRDAALATPASRSISLTSSAEATWTV